jgi:SSS family solute:Na+ symporter
MATLIAFVVFVGVLLGIGVWGMKRTSSIGEFVLAGRNVGPWLSALSYGTAYFSAVVFIGFAGKLGWQFGWSAMWLAVANTAFGACLAWFVLGARTRRMTHQLNALTMPEFFAARYASPGLRWFAAVLIGIFLLPYSAGVFKGLGHLFESNFHIPYLYALVGMTVITGLYVVLGGYAASSRTDFVQGGIMLVGSLVMVAVFIVKNGGSPSGVIEAVQEAYARHRQDIAPAARSPGLLLALIFMTSFGAWGLPQMVQKFYAIKDEKMITRGAIVATVFSIIVVCSAYFVGGLTHLYFDQVGKGDFDRLVPQMLTQAMPPVLMGLVLLLILSASMSTLASLTLVSASAVVVDVAQAHQRAGWSAGRRMLLIRVATVVMVALACGLALLAERQFQVIVDLISLSWGAVAGAFMAPYLYGLYWRRTTRQGAAAGMVCGVGLAVGLFVLRGPAFLPIAACLAMIVPFAVVPLVSLITPKLPAELVERAFAPPTA